MRDLPKNIYRNTCGGKYYCEIMVHGVTHRSIGYETVAQACEALGILKYRLGLKKSPLLNTKGAGAFAE